MTDFDKILQEYIRTLDQNLERYLQISYPPDLGAAMKYSVFPGGKRVRPVILLSVCQMFGGVQTNALPFACALEMIHTYSMIHDDLPAMDDDTLRRGRPTNHVVFGEAMAILAGDALLNRAFEVMSAHCAEHSQPHNLQAMSKIATYAGAEGMIGGQVMDMALEGGSAAAEQLEYV